MHTGEGASQRRAASDDRQPENPGWRVEGGPPKKPSFWRSPSERLGLPGGRRFWAVLLLLLVLNWLIVSQIPDKEPRINVPYSFFRAQIQAGNVAEVTSRGASIQGRFNRPAAPPNASDANTRFETERPAFADDELIQLLISRNVVVNATPVELPRPLWMTLVLGFGPTLLIVAIIVWFWRRVAAGSGALSGLGRSKAMRYEDSEHRTTFDDVAGIDEAEEELIEVVDFLRNPERYTRLGAAIPKGVLLSGPPGTGKTLLARAVAGEANVPFFSLSASEFVEMVVGVGASRVRDLFKQAKEAAPAIVFIDELDAIGRSRGSGASFAGHDEREQTLNQILTEMDGFTGSEGVIVLASTNRPEILDSALLRPGRFDRRVAVSPPDQQGRLRILEVHTRGVPLADDVDLGGIAATTPGMVGADLKNLVNEAALTAARHDHEAVELGDFTDALERVVLGAERRIVVGREERERTAYHEAGHALLGMLEPGADTVRKVSIVPRGLALGVTFQSPDADRYGYTARYLRGRIVGALGGRAAEELVYDDFTTGAESDLEIVTGIARRMVGRWGMSEAIGPVSVLPASQENATFFPGAGRASEQLLELVDAEARRIIESCYDDALETLRLHREQLEALAQKLLERETLDEVEAYAVAGIARRPEPTPA
jgi:cell division protease FtsH